MFDQRSSSKLCEFSSHWGTVHGQSHIIQSSSRSASVVGDNAKISILFVIRSLNRGGAERQLLELLRQIDKAQFAPSLITMYTDGELISEVSTIEGLQILSLSKKSRWDVSPIWRF